MDDWKGAEYGGMFSIVYNYSNQGEINPTSSLSTINPRTNCTWNRAFWVRGRRLTTWDTAQPYKFVVELWRKLKIICMGFWL